MFRERADYVKAHFLQKHGPQQYVLRPEFDTQKKVEAYFKGQADGEHILFRDGLYDLISNVILLEQEGSDKTAFHFRIALDQTSSFRYLSPQLREKNMELVYRLFLSPAE